MRLIVLVLIIQVIFANLTSADDRIRVAVYCVCKSNMKMNSKIIPALYDYVKTQLKDNENLSFIRYTEIENKFKEISYLSENLGFIENTRELIKLLKPDYLIWCKVLELKVLREVRNCAADLNKQCPAKFRKSKYENKFGFYIKVYTNTEIELGIIDCKKNNDIIFSKIKRMQLIEDETMTTKELIIERRYFPKMEEKKEARNYDKYSWLIRNCLNYNCEKFKNNLKRVFKKLLKQM